MVFQLSMENGNVEGCLSVTFIDEGMVAPMYCLSYPILTNFSTKK